MTKSQLIAADVAALLRARNPLLWIVTREEARVEQYLAEAAAAAGYVPRTWDVAQGVVRMDGKSEDQIGDQDPGTTLKAIDARARDASRASDAFPQRGLWIMRDLPAWLSGPAGAATNRQLRNLARSLPGTPREQAQAVIVLTPSGEIPPELAGHATVIEWPLPDREEIGAILDAALAALPDNVRKDAAPNGTRSAAIDAAVGLSGEEAAACFAKSLVQLRKIDPKAVAQEKRRVVAREGVLEWFDAPPGGLSTIGGLDNLKTWLKARASAFTVAARAYGLQRPKGMLVGGIAGTGKSLTAKAVSAEWGVPLIRFDVGALRSKFVGDSEANIRKAFRIIEAIGPCVVWIDEIEKALQGATSGSSDGGVSADALGAILSWMQDRQGDAFVIATANDVESLPPELLRKGRFDEVFWVDLPTVDEVASILAVAIRKSGRDPVALSIDLPAVAAKCPGFTGSEVAALVPEAMFAAFGDGAREITTADLIEVASKTVPLSKTAAEKIDRLRSWAKGRAKPASLPKADGPVAAQVRNIDL